MLYKALYTTYIMVGCYTALVAQQQQQDDWDMIEAPAAINIIGTPVTVRIFPNPAVNSVFIDHDYAGDATITLLNMQGQRIFYEEHFVGKMLNVRPYDAGVYWLCIVLGQETFMEQVVVSK